MHEYERLQWGVPISGPPTQRMTTLNRPAILEPQCLVGWVDAQREEAATLQAYGICLDYARFDLETERWERCLFSTSCATLLVELYDQGEFPWLLEAALSLAEAEWRVLSKGGLEERPAIPRWRYLTPAPSELLAKVARLNDETPDGPQLQVVRGGKRD